MENDLLYEIFLGEYDPTPRTSGITPQEGEELQAIYQKLQEALGVEEMDRWFGLEADRAQRIEYQYFRAGFRLGARLTQERFTPA